VEAPQFAGRSRAFAGPRAFKGKNGLRLFADRNFKRIATVECGSCGGGCPTVLEAKNGDDLVIVGRLSIILEKWSSGFREK